MTSPGIATRKIATDILTFFCSWNHPVGFEVVVQALDKLQAHHAAGSGAVAVTNVALGRFDGLLAVVEATLDGRGRMGSLVGASEEMKRVGGQVTEASLQEYGVSHPRVGSTTAHYPACQRTLLQQPDEGSRQSRGPVSSSLPT